MFAVMDPHVEVDVIDGAKRLALIAGLPCVLVLERPFGQARGKARGGSDKGRELWRACWRECGGVMKRILSVYPSVWRSQALGKGYGSAARGDARAREQVVANKIKLDAEAVGMTDAGEDEAPAICIGVWSAHAGVVGAVLPKVIA